MSNGNGEMKQAAAVHYDTNAICAHLDANGIRVEVFSSHEMSGKWTCRMYPRDMSDIKTVSGTRAGLQTMWSDICKTMPMAIVDAYRKLMEHADHVDAALPLPRLTDFVR